MMSNPTPIKILASYRAGDSQIEYLTDAEGQVGLRILPFSLLDAKIAHRGTTPLVNGRRVDSETVQPLVALHVAEDRWPGSLSQGRTLQHSPTTQALSLESHHETITKTGFECVTTMRGPRGIRCEHRLQAFDHLPGFVVATKFENSGDAPLTLTLLTSFSLGGMTPFAADDAAGRLVLHRFRSSWSQEGRHVAEDFESLHLERSWSGFPPQAERFGQVGSLPVRGFFPTAAIEDRVAGVFWGAQLAHNGSWQMEVFRTRDYVALTGGLADFEFGHWNKSIPAGESLTAPIALIATCHGDIDEICRRLVALQDVLALPDPVVEKELPIVFNEYCTTWGQPTEASVLAQARRLQGTPVKYLVIDAGWSAKELGVGEQISNGDWQIETRNFPNGFAAMNRKVREMGLIPGLWFEFEVCTEGAEVFFQSEHQLTRFGAVLQIGKRRFWDFRDPWVIEYLRERVVHFLRDQGFGYLKVDYNETIGVGCDSDDGLGEGLRQQMAGVAGFFALVREEMPELVIENCASGGHRLEPLMMGLTSMSSFSDAHECPEIPIIAANLHRLMPVRKCQIWAVLRATDDLRRIGYSLSAGFLGRLCLSGEISDLSDEQSCLLDRAMNLYREVVPILDRGRSFVHRNGNTSIRNPQGTQAVLRVSADGEDAVLVWHTFALDQPTPLEIELPSGEWSHDKTFGRREAVTLFETRIRVRGDTPWEGGVLVLSLRLA